MWKRPRSLRIPPPCGKLTVLLRPGTLRACVRYVDPRGGTVWFVVTRRECECQAELHLPRYLLVPSPDCKGDDTNSPQRNAGFRPLYATVELVTMGSA